MALRKPPHRGCSPEFLWASGWDGGLGRLVGSPWASVPTQVSHEAAAALLEGALCRAGIEPEANVGQVRCHGWALKGCGRAPSGWLSLLTRGQKFPSCSCLWGLVGGRASVRKCLLLLLIPEHGNCSTATGLTLQPPRKETARLPGDTVPGRPLAPGLGAT